MSRWQTILAIDSDRWACETYRANFPGVPVACGPAADYIASLPAADVILGGPPCQPFSMAGEGEGESDERDSIPDFIAAVGKVRPRMFLMENVDGLLTQRHIRYFGKAVEKLERLGYSVKSRELDAVAFGVPQFRNRVWVWGIRSDIARCGHYGGGIGHRWPQPTHAWPPPDSCMFDGALLPGVTVGEALGLNGFRVIGGGRNHLADADGVYRRDSRDITDEPCATIVDCNGATTPQLVAIYDAQNDRLQSIDRPIGTIQGEAQSKGGNAGHYAIFRHRGASVTRRTHPMDEPAPTINAFGKGGGDGLFLVGSPPLKGWKRIRGDLWGRRLTPWECCRLQSVPDSFVWPQDLGKTHAWRIVGNGWASRMGAVFAEAFALADHNSRTVIDLFCGGGLGACGWHGRYWKYAAPAPSSPPQQQAAAATQEKP